MKYLEARTGQVVTRDELLKNVWEQSFGGSNVVDAVVKSLRRKLGPLGSTLETVIGHGYRFTGFPPRPAQAAD
jgi:DNA-binding response OmpR family regulator